MATPVGLVDVGLTIAEIAGAGAFVDPGPLDGRSLHRHLSGSPASDKDGLDRPIYAETLVPSLDYLWPPRQRVLTADAAVSRRAGNEARTVTSWEWPEWPVPVPASGPADEDQMAFLSAADEIVGQIESGDAVAAAVTATPFAAAQPDVPMAARLLAVAQRASGDLDGAISTLESRLQETPSPDLAVALARLLEDAGRPAAAAWAQATVTASGRPRFHLGEAEALLAAENVEGAIAAAQMTVKSHPRSAALNAALGRIYLLAGQPAEAIRMFATAIQLSPGSSLYHRSSAAAVQSLGNIDGALQMLDEARRIDASDSLIHRDIGDVHAARGDVVKATESYRASLPTGTLDADASLFVAENLLRMGQVDGAAEVVEAVLVGDPGNARGHYTRAQIALRKNDGETAEKEFLESLRTGGEQPTVYYGLARLAVLRSDESQALAYLERVFATNDTALRQIIRQDELLNSPERSDALKRAVQRFLIGLPPSAEPSS